MVLKTAPEKMRMFPASIKSHDDGFTLFEMLVVMAIIAMVLTIAPSIYAGIIPGYEVRQFANDVANEARGMRRQARITGSVKSLIIDTDAQQLISQSAALDVPDDVVLSFESATAYGFPLSDEVQFYSSGASSGGILVLERGNLRVEVSFDWLSGAIEVHQ